MPAQHPIDPQARAVMESLARLRLPAFEQIPPAEARRQYRETRSALRPSAPSLQLILDLAAAGTHGAIPLRLYRASEGTRPALIYFHGGGWVLGDLETHDVVCRQIAASADIVVIAVDYRLAPEHSFPAALEDAWSATTWIAAHSTMLGLDARRIAVGGDSAGGGLAASVTMMARDTGAPTLAYQVLVYPVTDLRADSASYSTFADGYWLTRDAMKWYIAQYAPDPATHHDWRASPLLAGSLTGLPSALVVAAECDPLRDEGAQYAERLRHAGVDVEYLSFDGMIHGFLTMGGKIDAANRAVDEIARALRRVRAG